LGWRLFEMIKLTKDKPFQLKQVKGIIVDTRTQASWNFTEKNIIRIEVESGNRKLFYEVNDEFNQNKKLRELIKKSIEENERYKNDYDSGGLYYELKQLLEDSKK